MLRRVTRGGPKHPTRHLRTELEIYSRVVLADAQESYDKVIDRFSV